MKKDVQKPVSKVEQARRKLKALTRRKSHSSLDTEFGILTVEAPPQSSPAPRPRPKSKR